MATIPLANLSPALLEKVITKLDYKSYFRVQQTCHGVNEFVRRLRNVCVRLDGSYALRFDSVDLSKFRLGPSGGNVKMDVEGLYGIRFHELWLHGTGQFDQFYDFLKTHRITCAELNTIWSKWTKEECAALFQVLEPVSVHLTSIDSDRFEALFLSPQLERVAVHIDSPDVDSMTLRLLSSFSEVGIHLWFSTWPEDLFQCLRTFLQILRSQSVPTLRKFKFSTPGRGMLLYEDFEAEFRDFDLVVSSEWSKNRLPSALVKMPNGYSFKIVNNAGGDWINAFYGPDYPDSERSSYCPSDKDMDDLNSEDGSHCHCSSCAPESFCDCSSDEEDSNIDDDV